MDELRDIALEQYEQVPAHVDRVRGLKHVGRDISGVKVMPKRVRVVYDLMRYIFKDYGTIVMVGLLIGTVWRALNTLELIWIYAQRYSLVKRFFKPSAEAVLDSSIKDLSLQLKLTKEFILLLRDVSLFFLLMIDIIMIYRAKSVVSRLQGIWKKKQERKEVQTVEYVKKIARFTRISKSAEEKAQLNADVSKRKRIINLSKNIMSILLPYLE